MLVHSYPLPRRGVGSVQASGDVFSLNYLSPCISVREGRSTCAGSGSNEFFEKPWLPAGSFKQLWTISQAVLPPAQPGFSFLREITP